MSDVDNVKGHMVTDLGKAQVWQGSALVKFPTGNGWKKVEESFYITVEID